RRFGDILPRWNAHIVQEDAAGQRSADDADRRGGRILGRRVRDLGAVVHLGRRARRLLVGVPVLIVVSLRGGGLAERHGVGEVVAAGDAPVAAAGREQEQGQQG